MKRFINRALGAFGVKLVRAKIYDQLSLLAGNGQSEKIDELAAKHEMIADRTELDEARKALAIDMTKRMHVVFGSRMYANPDDLGLQIYPLVGMTPEQAGGEI